MGRKDWLASVILGASAILGGMVAACQGVAGMEVLFDAPAAVWTEALPLGNGRLGAMVYGGVEKELIPINEDTIWSGGPGPNITGGLSPETFAKAREQVFAGDYEGVRKTLPGGYRGAAAYEYFGKVLLRILPALPDAWPDGSAKGLRAQGGYSVDITWRQGKVVDLNVSGGNPDGYAVWRVQ